MAQLFYKDKPLIGIDFDATGIRVMAVDAKKRTVIGYGSINLDPEQAQGSLEGDGNYHTEQLKKLLNENIIGSLPSDHAAVSVPTSRTYTRTFPLPTELEKSLNDAVLTEADQYIPIPSGSLYIDHQIIGRSKEELTVLMSAVNKKTIDTISSIVTKAGLRPVLFEPGINAIARVLVEAEEAHLPTIIVNVGPASTDIAILEGGFVRITGSVAVGGNTFTLAIAKKLNVSLESAHQLKTLNGLNAGPRQKNITDALNPNLEKIATEIEKVIRYYHDRINKDTKLEQLLVVGSGSNVPGIGDFMTNRLLIPARVAAPWHQFEFRDVEEPRKQFRTHFVTATGLASLAPEKVRLA